MNHKTIELQNPRCIVCDEDHDTLTQSLNEDRDQAVVNTLTFNLAEVA